MTQVAFHFDAAHAAAQVLAPAPAAAAPSAIGAAAHASSGTAASPSIDPADTLGFDHARYGLVPPADCLWPGHPVREGWERGRRRPGLRARAATPAVRRWLALRLRAWREGAPFDDLQLTPGALRALEATQRCPVTGAPLRDDAVPVRLDPARGWVAGNLVLVAPPVAERLDTLTWGEAVAALQAAEQAAREDAAGRPSMRDGGAFTLRQWRRAVALKSLATPLPADEARAQPLRVLPPSRVRLVNPIQGLQALLSLQLATPGWGQRSSKVAASIPLLLRCEFHLFFHTLLAATLRATQAGAGEDGRGARREAVEQAWNDAAVQRRWQRFAGRVDDALAELLVVRLGAEPLPGLQVLQHTGAAIAG